MDRDNAVGWLKGIALLLVVVFVCAAAVLQMIGYDLSAWVSDYWLYFAAGLSFFLLGIFEVISGNWMDEVYNALAAIIGVGGGAVVACFAYASIYYPGNVVMPISDWILYGFAIFGIPWAAITIYREYIAD